eukprot:XP_001706183.1 Hypothetical protein GL50803_20605 [Giardia lamblia ATCC 50803]
MNDWRLDIVFWKSQHHALVGGSPEGRAKGRSAGLPEDLPLIMRCPSVDGARVPVGEVLVSQACVELRVPLPARMGDASRTYAVRRDAPRQANASSDCEIQEGTRADDAEDSSSLMPGITSNVLAASTVGKVRETEGLSVRA